jgi:hypothetical protein
VERDPGPLTQALCLAHARRKLFVLADIAANAKRGKHATPISPIAFEAVKRIDALFDIEREINGSPPTSAWNDASRKAVFSSPNLGPGCEPSGPGCPAVLRLPSLSTTC